MPGTTTKSSPAKIAANQANARRSTGPRTEAGKARSRANAVKHGLTSAGVALPGEDAAQIEAQSLQAQEEFGPSTLAGMKLVRDVAALWVRQDRAREFEATALDRRVRRAADDFDQARQDRADGLIDAIETNPRAYHRALLAMPEGVDRLVDGLTMLLGEMTAPARVWSQVHHKRLDALFGYRVGDLPWNRPTRFSRAVLGDFEAIGAAEVEHVEPDDRQEWATIQLIEAIQTEIERLEAHQATIDRDRIAEDRADAVALARFDPGPAGSLARRYVGAAARDLSRTLRDLHHVEARYGADPDADTDTDTDAGSEPITTMHLGPDPAPTPNPLPDQQDPARLASFGKLAPATSDASPVTQPAAPVVVPSAPIHALRPVPTAEPALFYPEIR